MNRILGIGLIVLVALLCIAQLFLQTRGVGFVTGVVVYLLIWWTVLFMVLPIGIRSQHESGTTVPGSERGAPADPQLKRKAWLVSRIAAGLWLVYFVLFEFELVRLPGLALAG